MLVASLGGFAPTDDRTGSVLFLKGTRHGEFRKLVRAVSDKGWGLMAMGSVRTPRYPDWWDIILKVRYCTREELVAVLEKIDGQEIIDLRETKSVYAS